MFMVNSRRPTNTLIKCTTCILGVSVTRGARSYRCCIGRADEMFVEGIERLKYYYVSLFPRVP